ncbi:MAG: hypothetical protein KJZ95_19780, partial [Caldilinea sp.]|nr:hypothetical protein [Caldilinea sp.]
AADADEYACAADADEYTHPSTDAYSAVNYTGADRNSYGDIRSGPMDADHRPDAYGTARGRYPAIKVDVECQRALGNNLRCTIPIVRSV